MLRMRLRTAQAVEAAGWDGIELANRANIGNSTARAFMRNFQTRLDFDALNRVASALGVLPTTLLEEYEDDEDDSV